MKMTEQTAARAQKLMIRSFLGDKTLSSVSWIFKALEHLLADLVGLISLLLFGILAHKYQVSRYCR